MATRGSKRATTEQTGGDVKRQRQGVGTSVVDLIPGPVDDFALLLLKVKAERLRPKGKGEVISALSVVTAHSPPLSCHAHGPLALRFEVIAGQQHPLGSGKYTTDSAAETNAWPPKVLNNSGQFYGFLEQKDIVRYIINVLFRDFSETQYANIDKLFSNVRAPILSWHY